VRLDPDFQNLVGQQYQKDEEDGFLSVAHGAIKKGKETSSGPCRTVRTTLLPCKEVD
jgi:hypothetical protein